MNKVAYVKGFIKTAVGNKMIRRIATGLASGDLSGGNVARSLQRGVKNVMNYADDYEARVAKMRDLAEQKGISNTTILKRWPMYTQPPTMAKDKFIYARAANSRGLSLDEFLSSPYNAVTKVNLGNNSIGKRTFIPLTTHLRGLGFDVQKRLPEPKLRELHNQRIPRLSPMVAQYRTPPNALFTPHIAVEPGPGQLAKNFARTAGGNSMGDSPFYETVQRGRMPITRLYQVQPGRIGTGIRARGYVAPIDPSRYMYKGIPDTTSYARQRNNPDIPLWYSGLPQVSAGYAVPNLNSQIPNINMMRQSLNPVTWRELLRSRVPLRKYITQLPSPDNSLTSLGGVYAKRM